MDPSIPLNSRASGFYTDPAEGVALPCEPAVGLPRAPPRLERRRARSSWISGDSGRRGGTPNGTTVRGGTHRRAILRGAVQLAVPSEPLSMGACLPSLPNLTGDRENCEIHAVGDRRETAATRSRTRLMTRSPGPPPVDSVLPLVPDTAFGFIPSPVAVGRLARPKSGIDADAGSRGRQH
jgi:hypothetical protein